MVAPNGPCTLLTVTDTPRLVTACFACSKIPGSDVSKYSLHMGRLKKSSIDRLHVFHIISVIKS